jgi:hypothetical protein
MLKDISRTAVDRYLKVVRTPVDAVLKRGGDRTDALALKVDRADAAARSAAGTAIRDEALKDDARRRRRAADERARAMRLRGVAEEHKEQAEETTTEAREEAERKRKQAEQAARRAQSSRRT